jgi:hypothetical protein
MQVQIWFIITEIPVYLPKPELRMPPCLLYIQALFYNVQSFVGHFARLGVRKVLTGAFTFWIHIRNIFFEALEEIEIPEE